MYGGIVYKQTLRSVKLTTGKKGKKTELTGKGPLRRRRSELDCSATEEEEEEELYASSSGDPESIVTKRTIRSTESL
jgi:hypothetical protein